MRRRRYRTEPAVNDLWPNATCYLCKQKPAVTHGVCAECNRNTCPGRFTCRANKCDNCAPYDWEERAYGDAAKGETYDNPLP